MRQSRVIRLQWKLKTLGDIVMEGCPAQTTIDSIPNSVVLGVHINVAERGTCAAIGERVIQGWEEVQGKFGQGRGGVITVFLDRVEDWTKPWTVSLEETLLSVHTCNIWY